MNLRIGTVVGLAAEAVIARRLGWRVAIGGATAAGAQAAARRLIDEDIDALVSFGLAGGLDPALRPGALIVPSEEMSEHAAQQSDKSGHRDENHRDWGALLRLADRLDPTYKN